MLTLAPYMPTLPGFAGSQTYAAWPVWGYAIERAG
jgi:hypothetical protein